MVHCFYYPNGLDGTIGDLMLLPRSHRTVMDRGAFNQLCEWGAFLPGVSFSAQLSRSIVCAGGQEKLPGSLLFGSENPLPRGSVVIAHSAVGSAALSPAPSQFV